MSEMASKVCAVPSLYRKT